MEAGEVVENIIDDDTDDELRNVNVSQRIRHYQQNIRRFIDSKSYSILSNNSQKMQRSDNIKLTKERRSKSVPSLKAPKASPRRKSNYEVLGENIQVVETNNQAGKDDSRTIDNDDPHSKPRILPSVRLLTLQFSKSKSHMDVNIDERVPSMLRTKFASHQSAGAQGEIHSITARTIGRRFRETLHRARPIILDRNIKYKEVTDTNNNVEACGDGDEADQGYKRVTAVPVMLLTDANIEKEVSDSDDEYCC